MNEQTEHLLAMEDGLPPSPRPGSEAGRTYTLTDSSGQPQEDAAEKDLTEPRHLLPPHLRIKKTLTSDSEEIDGKAGTEDEEEEKQRGGGFGGGEKETDGGGEKKTEKPLTSTTPQDRLSATPYSPSPAPPSPPARTNSCPVHSPTHARNHTPIHARTHARTHARSSSSGSSRSSAADSQLLHCGICTRRYSNPKVLPCLHTFCERCLISYTPPESLTLTCPVCRQQSILPKAGGCRVCRATRG